MQQLREPPEIHRVKELDVEALPRNAVSRVHVEVVGDGLANDVLIPLLVARGRRTGPVFGLTAAVHGNELNGIPVIHDVFRHLELGKLRGTVVGVVAVNVPGLNRHERHFVDGQDLNRLFPGKEDGTVSQVYAHRILARIVSKFHFLVDLHTASFGRVNSLYVRADMTHHACARMAYLQRPQIIVHNAPSDRTLRGAAMDLDIPAITVEVGDPQTFQPRLIRSTRIGIRSLLADARMLPQRTVAKGPKPVICDRSYWLYTDRGGLLEVIPMTTERVVKGQVVARLRNAFGDVIRTFEAPEDGVVVGRSVNPVGQTGARILHLGRVAPDDHGYQRREPLVSPEAMPSGPGSWTGERNKPRRS
jgi:predicted deacylase